MAEPIHGLADPGTSESGARVSREVRPLAELLPPGRLVEISGDRASGRTTIAVSVVKQFQRGGCLTAWVQPQPGALYPPDLHAGGVDLRALVCVHVPRGGKRPSTDLLRAGELLLRSGAFGLVVVDLSTDPPPPQTRWQARLAGVAREHGARLVLLTCKPGTEASAGPMIGLRVETQRRRLDDTAFELRPRVLRAKAGLDAEPAPEACRAPCGLD